MGLEFDVGWGCAGTAFCPPLQAPRGLQLKQPEVARGIAAAMERSFQSTEADQAVHARERDFFERIEADPDERVRVLTDPSYPFPLEPRRALALTTTAEILRGEKS